MDCYSWVVASEITTLGEAVEGVGIEVAQRPVEGLVEFYSSEPPFYACQPNLENRRDRPI